MKMNIFRFILTFGLITLSTAARNPSVCTQFKPGDHDPVKPNLTQFMQFSVRVESNFVNKKYTIDHELYFDYANSRAAMKSIVGGARKTNIYNFGRNELLIIDKDKNQCTVNDLANSPQYLALFGYKAGPHTAKMFTADYLLRFDQNTTEKWINRTSIRGIPCNLWRSCDYWASRNATMVVDWYFSVPGRTSTEDLKQVPIRCHVKGWVTGNQNGNNRSFEHFYDFMDFKTMLTNTKVFMTPEGVYCPNRNTTKQLPVPARAFHFTAEILDLIGNRIGRIKEWYDYNLNLVRFDSTPMSPSQFGQNPLTQIHDFNTGVAYIIDNFRGNCSVANISSMGFDVRNSDPTHVRIRSSKEFFYFDKTKYNYEGQKMARGILCDVWITQRNDWPTKGAGAISTWEWYFATSGYTADLPDHLSFGMPIMLEMTAPKLNVHAIYNIYAYDEQRPVVWDYDIGQCFNYTVRKDFQLLIPGNFSKYVYPNIDDFKYALLKSIKNKGSIISSLRVNNIQVDSADNHDILVSFTILDRPPPIGDVIRPKQEADLVTVTEKLRKAINNGSLTISLNVGSGRPITMNAKPNSLVSGTKYTTHTYYRQVQGPATITTSQYSGGAMAGLAVGMVVLFCLLGVGLMYVFLKRRVGPDVQVKYDKHEKEDITSDFS